jgi:uncharacterized protein YcfJ
MKNVLLSLLAVMMLASGGYAQDNSRAIPGILGGIMGGVLGHQVGKGKGKVAATIGGAILGSIIADRVANQKPTPSHDEIYGRADDGYAYHRVDERPDRYRRGERYHHRDRYGYDEPRYRRGGRYGYDEAYGYDPCRECYERCRGERRVTRLYRRVSDY